MTVKQIEKQITSLKKDMKCFPCDDKLSRDSTKRSLKYFREKLAFHKKNGYDGYDK